MLTMAIKQEANRLKMKYQTTDPYDICTSMDIQVIKRPMGASAQSCKGFFLVSSRCKLIVINSDLPESIQRIIIAHELGHAVLHSDSAISAFHEFAMFDDTDRMEYVGGATILSNIAGEQVEEYQVEITHVYPAAAGDTRNLMVQVTDPRLLETTGGIVQGMSGSPILQDGKLVGAVTHVLVNDPTRGYGILAENMVSQCVWEEQAQVS